jgi:hypothetical protein
VRGVYLYRFVINFGHAVPALNSRVYGFVLTNQLNQIVANRALIEAVRRLITYQATK